jgi:hypothetical protein
MTNREDALEQRLLLLGQQELQLEVRMKQLRERARTSGKLGHANDADAAWKLFETLRETLGDLQSSIARAERELYGLRSRRRS